VGQGRLWRTAAQRCVRAAFTTMTTHRARWDKASDAGLGAATALVNALLSSFFVDTMALGALAQLPGLKERARDKWGLEMDCALQQLWAALGDLEGACLSLEAAAGTLATAHFPTVGASPTPASPLPAMGLDEAEQAVAVFSAFPLAAFRRMAARIVQMYRRELAAKRVVVLALAAAREGGHKVVAVDGEGEGEGARFELAEDSGAPRPSRETLQAYLATWLLSPELDEGQVEEVMAHVNAEIAFAEQS